MRKFCRRRWTSLIRLLLLLVAVVTLTEANDQEAVMASFQKLPPPLIYYTDSVPTLECVARPRTAMVQIVYRKREDKNFNLLQRERVGKVTYTLSNPEILKDTDIHCKARTPSLGEVLSRPVRLKRARLSMKTRNERITEQKYFYKGNIAQILCDVPDSQPPAEIEFLKEGYKIGNQQKYKVVKLPHLKMMALLIRDFSKSDSGIYSCKASNPKTLQSVPLSRRVKMIMSSATKSIAAKYRLDDPFRKKEQRVELREGENVTVYCLPEGAPIPRVSWFRHNYDRSLPDNAKTNSAFGTLTLTNVKVNNQGDYMCNAAQGTGSLLTTAVKVSVRKRLKIINAPKTVKISQIGDSAEFSCTVTGGNPEGGNLAPEWYHNGRYINPLQTTQFEITNSTLKIKQVTTDLFGVYQCVARSRSEWDSAEAALIKSTQKLVTGEMKEQMLAEEEKARKDRAKKEMEKKLNRLNKRKKKRKNRKHNKNPYPDVREGNNRQPDIIGRNPMISRGTWDRSVDRNVRPSNRFRPQTSNPHPVDSRRGRIDGMQPRRTNTAPAIIEQPLARVLFNNMVVQLLWKYNGLKSDMGSFRIQYKELDGAIKDTAAWDAAAVKTLDEPIFKEYYYMVKHLKAGKRYRFRVVVVKKSGSSIYSLWSNEADFSHILDVQPHIVEVTPEDNTALRIRWKFSPHTPSGESVDLQYFVILVRRLIDKVKQQYEGYVEYKVKISNRELLVKGLRPGTHYQIVMYGTEAKNKGSSRKQFITRFSNAVSKTTAGAPPVGTNVVPPVKRHNSAESTKLMFWILGGLAGVMLVVMVFLVSLCLLRQRREKKRTRAAHHAQLNGTALDSYKDPAKMQFRRQQAQAQAQANNQFLLAQLGGNTVPGAPNHNHNGTWAAPHGHHQSQSYLRGSSASVQQLHQVPGSAMNLNVVPETQSLMMDHYHQQHNQQVPDMTTDLGGYGSPGIHGYHNQHGTLGSKSQLSGITSHHSHHPEHDMSGEMGYPMHTGSVGPYRPLGSGYAPFMTSGQRPSHLDVRPTPCGDAESIYSYFSQQEMGVQHCGLNDVPGGPPMPYRPQLAEAGSQTTDRQQHRHHRRRRRKQASVPPTGPGGPLPTAMEHSVAPSPPMMRDMAVNTELGSTEGTYDQPATSSHLPYGYPLPGGVSMAQYLPQDSSGGATASSAASSIPAYHSVTPPARMASLGPHHGYHYPQQQQQQVHHQHQHPQQPQQVDLGPAGPSDASTLTRRGTPTLFVDPPKMRDYSEYAIPETKA